MARLRVPVRRCTPPSPRAGKSGLRLRARGFRGPGLSPGDQSRNRQRDVTEEDAFWTKRAPDHPVSNDRSQEAVDQPEYAQRPSFTLGPIRGEGDRPPGCRRPGLPPRGRFQFPRRVWATATYVTGFVTRWATADSNHIATPCPLFIASRAPRASPPPHIEPKTIGLASLGAGLGPRGGRRGCLEVPPTGYTATANSKLT